MNHTQYRTKGPVPGGEGQGQGTKAREHNISLYMSAQICPLNSCPRALAKYAYIRTVYAYLYRTKKVSNCAVTSEQSVFSSNCE